MEKIQFFNKDCSVKYRSEEIGLLPKEFQLFQYLYRRPSRIFKREELLDAVWSMEAPTDRTVDDHVYRIRKKLKPFSSIVTIETVRGQGYQLKLTQNKNESPLLNDKEVSSNVKVLFHKYHLYGQGDALKLLEENQAAFGFEFDLQSKLYLKFMKGDFWWFLEQEDIPFWQKCYYYLHIYSYIEEDTEKCLDYFTKALAVEKLPPFHQLEIQLLNRLSLLIFTKETDKAREVLTYSKRSVQEQDLRGFIPFIVLTEIFLALIEEDMTAVNEKVAEVEALLNEYPFSREKAMLSVSKGLRCLAEDEFEEAKRYFDQGFDLFEEAKYVPGILISLTTILYFMKEFEIEGDIYDNYVGVRKVYEEKYNFRELGQKIERQFNTYLN